MAEYLIQGTTLDAIADAINAKTGGSSAMTPAEMAAAIAAIPSGGGGMSWELIADYTSDAQADVVTVTIPTGKQDSNLYRVHYQSDTNQWYAKPGFNSNYGGYSANTTWDCDLYISRFPNTANDITGTTTSSKYCMAVPTTTAAGAAVFGTGPLVSVGMSEFSTASPLKASINIKVWRLIES